MSNYLAIATVTATLQRIVQGAIQQDVAGARVTTVRPDANGSGTPEVGVNIYMYQASPNPAWRNADLRTTRPKGNLSKQAQAGLDLYYLMTFYGNDVEYEPQRLLGSTVRTLIDQPILTQEMISETILNSELLAGSTLADQVEKVTLTPAPMNTEELSKIWSVFFQTPYTLSFAYQGSTVLIEGDKPGKSAIPVQGRQFFVTATQSVINQVISEKGISRHFVLNDTIIVGGRRLDSNNVKVKIGDATLTPNEISDTEIKLNLAQLPAAEINTLRAGVQTLQIVHSEENSNSNYGIIGSNILPFVLCPTVSKDQNPQAVVTGYENNTCDAIIRILLDLRVDIGQRVFLLLNERNSVDPLSYVFPSQQRSESTREMVFAVKNINLGEYFVRVQVDGAESLLETNSDEYIYPVVEIR
jgi:hypothetical protein